METHCFIRICTLFVVLTLAGCGSKEMPKGGGASGRLRSVTEKPDLGLEAVNRLTPEQQKRFEALHRPFDKATIPGKKSTDDAAKQLEQIKASWDKIVFAKVKEFQRNYYLGSIETSEGVIEVTFADVEVPDLVRNFVALARTGHYDGAELRLSKDGGFAVIGSEADNAPYYLKPRALPRVLWAGAFVALTTEPGKTPGTQFAISLKEQPGDNATIFAADSSGQSAAVLEKIAKAVQAKPGSVRIKKIKIMERPVQAVDEKGLAFPEVDAQGLPAIKGLDPTAPPDPTGALPAGPGTDASSKTLKAPGGSKEAAKKTEPAKKASPPMKDSAPPAKKEVEKAAVEKKDSPAPPTKEAKKEETKDAAKKVEAAPKPVAPPKAEVIPKKAEAAPKPVAPPKADVTPKKEEAPKQSPADPKAEPKPEAKK